MGLPLGVAQPIKRRQEQEPSPTQALFWKPLRVERKRADRSRRGFVLLLVNPEYHLRP